MANTTESPDPNAEAWASLRSNRQDLRNKEKSGTPIKPTKFPRTTIKDQFLKGNNKYPSAIQARIDKCEEALKQSKKAIEDGLFDLTQTE